MAYLYEQSDLYILLETSKTEVKEGERVTFDIVLYDSNGEEIYLKDDITFKITYTFGTDKSAANSNDLGVLVETITIKAGESRVVLPMDILSDGIIEKDETFKVSIVATDIDDGYEPTYRNEIEFTIKDDGRGNLLGAEISIVEDEKYIVKLNDFGTIYAAEAIKITELPQNGKLYLDGKELLKSTELTIDDINAGKLIFIPIEDTDLDGSFTYQVKNDGKYSENATTSIGVKAVADVPTASITIEQIGTEAIYKDDNSSNNGGNTENGGNNIVYDNKYDYDKLSCGIKYTDTVCKTTNDEVIVKTSMDHYTINLGGGKNNLNVGKNVDWSNLFGGLNDDNVEVKGSIDHSTVNLGYGNNTLKVGGELDLSTVRTYGADDVVSVARDIKSSTVNLGAGKNTIEVGQDVSKSNIFTLQGDDNVNVKGSINSSVVNLGFGDNSLNVGKDFSKSSIHTYAGKDNVVIKGNASDALINLGEGKNILDVKGETTKTTVLTGTNKDTIILEGKATHTNVFTGGGEDRIFVGEGSDKTIIDGGSGYDMLYLPKGKDKYQFIDGIVCKKPVSYDEFLAKNQGIHGLSCHKFTVIDKETGATIIIKNIENITFDAKAEDLREDNNSNGGGNFGNGSGSTTVDAGLYKIYKVSYSAALKDIDGSETLSVKIDGLPSDAIINGVRVENGTITIDVPKNTLKLENSFFELKTVQNAENINLRITARATEENDNLDGKNFAEAEATNSGLILSNAKITINEDETYTVKQEDFGRLSSATLVAIAPIVNGALYYNGNLVASETDISMDEIKAGKLVFKPIENSDLDSGFSFKVDNKEYFTSINIKAIADEVKANINVNYIPKDTKDEIVIDPLTKNGYVVKSYDKLSCKVIITDPILKKSDDYVEVKNDMSSSTVNLGEGAKNALDIKGNVALGNIYSGKGDDKVFIDGNTKSTTINLGFGDNALSIGKDLHLSTVHTYAGDDIVKVGNSVTNTTINLGDGANSIDISNNVDWSNIFTSNGDDKLKIGKNLDHTTVNLGFGDNEITIGGTMDLSNLTTYSGNDTLHIKDSLDRSKIDLGSGKNSIIVENNLKASTVITGVGDDLVVVGGKAKDTNIFTGAGNDTIFINAAEKYTMVDGGLGYDVLFLSGSKNSYRFEEGIICKKPITWEEFVLKNKNTNGLNCKTFTIYEVDALGNRTGNKLEVRNIEDVRFDAKMTDFYDTREEFMVDISAALNDKDGSESLTVKIAGVPAGSELISNFETLDNKDGTWDIKLPKGTTDMYDSIILKAPEGTKDVDLKIIATSTELRGENQSTTEVNSVGEMKISGDDIDLTNVISKNTKSVDMTNAKADKISIDLDDILDLDSKKLVVKGDKKDIVELDKADWTQSGKESIAGKSYNVYTNSNVKLSIDEDVTINHI